MYQKKKRFQPSKKHYPCKKWKAEKMPVVAGRSVGNLMRCSNDFKNK